MPSYLIIDIISDFFYISSSSVFFLSALEIEELTLKIGVLSDINDIFVAAGGAARTQS